MAKLFGMIAIGILLSHPSFAQVTTANLVPGQVQADLVNNEAVLRDDLQEVRFSMQGQDKSADCYQLALTAKQNGNGISVRGRGPITMPPTHFRFRSVLSCWLTR